MNEKWRFDPIAFTRGSGFLLNVPTLSGWAISPSDAIWSGLDPNVPFGHAVNAQRMQPTSLGPNALIETPLARYRGFRQVACARTVTNTLTLPFQYGHPDMLADDEHWGASALSTPMEPA